MLDGTNLRQLRDMSLFTGNYSTGEKKIQNALNAISKALLEVCNRDFLTSEQIMFAGLLKALQGKFLDKGVRILMGRLSNLSGGAVETVIEKPQCFSLRLLSSL